MSAHIATQPSALDQRNGDSASLIEEIRMINLNYLLFAQHMIRKDRDGAICQLGLSEALADTINSLTGAQVMRIARLPQLLCQFRFVDHDIFSLLGDKLGGHTPLLPTIHASVLQARSTVDAPD